MPIIEVKNLSKLYQIGAKEAYGSLREEIMQAVTAPFKRRFSPDTASDTDSTLWALKDVSFEVNEGEVVGIIGRNGAGKSTLLKILSRITEPTSGRVTMRGRVASLLEVGTGFHPELTGRENIFLNGALLGMSSAEIRKKFNEIVAFSEIEKFLDTPVKRYSSGMYVRLAFAVAAHIEPEILIVDEVLAVGDAQFQKKCLGKMGEVAKGGRTVLFVSHNMAAIQNICRRAIFLSQGEIIEDGATELVVERYLTDSIKRVPISLSEREDRQGTGDIKFTSVKFQNCRNENVESFVSGNFAKFVIYFENRLNHDLKNFHIAIGIDDHSGNRITALSSEVIPQVLSVVPAYVTNIEIQIERLPLTEGRYGFTIFSTINGIVADWIQNAGFFNVESGDYYGTGKLPPKGQGNFLMEYKFNIQSRIGYL